jgi:hypothetical protein
MEEVKGVKLEGASLVLRPVDLLPRKMGGERVRGGTKLATTDMKLYVTVCGVAR